MPSVNSIIETALSGIGCPIGFQQLDDGAYIQAFPSVTYFCYLDQPEGWAEDVETEHGWYYQIDIWAKSNYLALETAVIAAMRAADWGYLSGQDMTVSFGADTVYRKSMRFKLTQFL